LAGDAPVREAIPLRVEQRVELVEAFRVALASVESLDGAIERGVELRILFVDPPDRLLQKPAVRDRRIALDQLSQLDGHAFGRQRLDALAQHDVVRLRRERQALVVVAEEETVGVEVQRELLRLERLAVRTAEDGKDDAVVAPVDVEVVDEARLRPVFQDAHPPRVFRGRRHVIGDDVQEKPEAVAPKLFVQRVEIVVRAEIGVQRVRVDDVVTVRAPLARLQDRRGVDVADAEPREVAGDTPCVIEGELRIELQAIRGGGDAVHQGGEMCERDAFLHFLHPPCVLITTPSFAKSTLLTNERSSTMKARVVALLVAIAVTLPTFAQRGRPSAPPPNPQPPQQQQQPPPPVQNAAFGLPLRALSTSDNDKFVDGRTEFLKVENVNDGLGPVFNGRSCGECHNAPAPGGGSNRLVTRFGTTTNGVFDPLAQL